MSFLALCSTAAILIGLSSALPQLTTMLRARSAAGQSALGWSLGLVVNVLMAYVNAAGYGALLLACGNVVSAGICATAVILVKRLGALDAAPPAAPLAEAVPLHELPTLELVALRETVDGEARRRGHLALAA